MGKWEKSPSKKWYTEGVRGEKKRSIQVWEADGWRTSLSILLSHCSTVTGFVGNYEVSMPESRDYFLSLYGGGLRALLVRLGSAHSRYTELCGLQRRLNENLHDKRVNGDSETLRNERHTILGSIDSLALEEVGFSFNEICEDPEGCFPHAAPPPTGQNPFICGQVVPPAHFYGRERQRNDIRAQIGGRTPGSVSIVGLRRSGKSSLLRYVLERTGEFCPGLRPLIVSLSLSDPRFHTPEGMTDGLRRGIKLVTRHDPWPGDENDDPWAISDGLEALRNNGYRLIVLIDEFDGIADHLEHFKHWGDDWREKAATHHYFSLVVASLRPIDEIYEQVGQTSRFYNIFTQTVAGTFAPHEWQTLVSQGFASDNGAVRDPLSPAHLVLIDELAGGLPHFVQLAASLLWQHGDQTETRAAFVQQARPFFGHMWRNLRKNEQATLRAIVDGHSTPDPAIVQELQQYGVVRDDGRVFSSAFADFVRQ